MDSTNAGVCCAGMQWTTRSQVDGSACASDEVARTFEGSSLSGKRRGLRRVLLMASD